MILPEARRKLGLYGASLTLARLNKQSGTALDQIRDELEQVMIDTGYLQDAPFFWISIGIRYGLVDEDIPHYHRISKKYGDLPLAIEVNVERMISADLETLKYIIRVAVLKALIHAGERYKRPTTALQDLLAKELGKNP